MKTLSEYLNISKSKIIYLNDNNRGHYDVKPTPFTPRVGKYLKINKEKDFKKSLISLVEELKKNSCEKNIKIHN